MEKPKLRVILHDIHYPKHDKPTFRAVMRFIKSNKVDGLVLGGDQLDNEEISHHNRAKIIYRERASYKRNTEGFDRDILKPLEQAVGKVPRVWITGNHCDWERQLVEENPELEGTVERPELLRLEQRGWKVVP